SRVQQSSAYQEPRTIRATLSRSRRKPRSVLGTNRRGASLVSKVGPRAGLESSLGEMVRGRLDQPFVQLSRPARRYVAPQQSSHNLGSRARRSSNAHLSTTATGSLEVRKRFEIARNQERRHRRDLH